MATTQRRRRLTVEESADRLGVSKKSIRRWIADGTLPAFRINGHMIRIDPDDLDRLVQPIRATHNGDVA